MFICPIVQHSGLHLVFLTLYSDHAAGLSVVARPACDTHRAWFVRKHVQAVFRLRIYNLKSLALIPFILNSRLQSLPARSIFPTI